MNPPDPPSDHDVQELIDHLEDAAAKGQFGLVGEPLVELPDPPEDTLEITCVAGEKDGNKGVFLAFSHAIAYIAWTPEEARDLAERLCIEAEKIDGIESHVRRMKGDRRPVHGHSAEEKSRGVGLPRRYRKAMEAAEDKRERRRRRNAANAIRK